MESRDYFVAVWGEHKIENILHFYSAMDAWQYVTDMKIQFYSVYEADCVIDNSGEARVVNG